MYLGKSAICVFALDLGFINTDVLFIDEIGNIRHWKSKRTAFRFEPVVAITIEADGWFASKRFHSFISWPACWSEVRPEWGRSTGSRTLCIFSVGGSVRSLNADRSYSSSKALACSCSLWRARAIDHRVPESRKFDMEFTTELNKCVPGLGYVSGGYDPFFITSFATHSRAILLISSSVAELVERQMFNQWLYYAASQNVSAIVDTCECHIDRCLPHIIRKRERNEVKASRLVPPTVIVGFFLRSF